MSNGARTVLLRTSTSGRRRVEPLRQASARGLEIKEVKHIQAWLESYPELCGEELLVLSSQDVGPFANDNSRPDVVALDRKGNIVVVEAKTGRDRNVEWQALKYAARLSAYSLDETLSTFLKYRQNPKSPKCRPDATLESCRQELESFLDDAQLDNIGDEPVRIILVAPEFEPTVLHTVEWLWKEFSLNIACVRLDFYQASDEGDRAIIVAANRIFPPEGGYLSRERARDRTSPRKGRASNLILRLIEAGLLAPGDTLYFNTRHTSIQNSPEFSRRMEELRAQRGEKFLKATLDAKGQLVWHYQDQTLPASALARAIVIEVGWNPASLRGTEFWVKEGEEGPLTSLEAKLNSTA